MKESRRKLVKDENEAMEALKRYTEIRERLQKHGVPMEDLGRLASLMVNLRGFKYEPYAIIEFYSEDVDLRDRKQALVSEVSSLSREKTKLGDEIREMEKTVEDNKDLAQSVKELKRLRLTPDKVKDLMEKVSDISVLHGLDIEKAVEKFFTFLDDQYDAKLGYENQLEILRERLYTVKKKVEERQELLGVLERNYGSRMKYVEDLRDLNEMGVSNDELSHWTRILQENDVDLPTFRERIKELGGLKDFFEEIRGRQKEIERRISLMRGEVEELEKLRVNLEVSVKTLTGEAIAEVKKHLEETHGVIEGFRSRLQEQTKETHKEIKKLLKETGEQWKNEAEKLKKGFGPVVEEAKKVMETISEVRDEVKRLKAFEPLLRLQSGKDIPSSEALPTMMQVLALFNKWLWKNKMLEAHRECEGLMKTIDGELHAP